MNDSSEIIKVIQYRLKKMLDSVAFLELNKDVNLGHYIKLPYSIPIPIKAQDMVNGIKSGEYGENIPFEKFVDSMIYVIGCDEEFKYNTEYISILKNCNARIDSFIMNKALMFVQGKDYISALIYFNALEKISDNHNETSYNIANTYRMIALDAKGKGKDEEYEFYHRLGYLKLNDIKSSFPQFYGAYYLKGLYHMDDDCPEEALDEWQKGLSLTADEEIKKNIGELITAAMEKIVFEEGRGYIIDGEIPKGLKLLMPLAEKYDDWSEVKYYVAMGYRKFGNYVKAKIILKELLDKGEDFHELYNELGLCCFCLDDIQGSVRYLEKSVELKKDNPAYLCNLSLAYYKSGDKQNAEKLIKKAYDLDPDDEQVKECKVWIEKLP